MHWFHEVGDMRWLVVFWVASFLILFGLFVLMAQGGKPRGLKRVRRGPASRPYEPHAPRPSI